MTFPYSMIEIFISESARSGRKSLAEALVDYTRDLKIGARCMVLKGTDACYENGDRATRNILELSYNMPIKVEILLPSSELARVLPEMEAMVGEGIVTSREITIHRYRIRPSLIPSHLRVRDIMTPAPKAVSRKTPVSDTARLLCNADFRGVPVVDEQNRPAGIITQTDLIYRANLPLRVGLMPTADRSAMDRLLAELAGKCAEEIMSHPVVTISADSLATDAVRAMIRHQVKRMPVTDGEGRLAGMLSRIDIFQAISRDFPNRQALRQRNVATDDPRFVSDIMHRETRSVLPETPVLEVIRLIDADRIQRVAVVDKAGRFLGMISDRDLLAVFDRHPRGVWEYIAALTHRRGQSRPDRGPGGNLLKKSAGEVMQRNLLTVLEETVLDEAIHLMTAKGIKRLPVLDQNGCFKGMISREQLLRMVFPDS
ncbi:MAG: DUF190 domain-containing protein [Thermodesulfobacteriota bacterium]